MPPKPKLHKQSGKSIIRPPKVSNETPSTSSGLSPELEQQFEVELCWCIQQLQTALKSGKLNAKDVQEYTKSLNTLMSNNAPIIKKRQVMRLCFGDYRAKMAAEEKRLAKNVTTIRVKPAEPNKNSKFLKKSVWKSSSNDFKFNFDVKPEECDITNGVQQIDLSNSEKRKAEKNEFHFLQSSNNFRFNFDCTENENS